VAEGAPGARARRAAIFADETGANGWLPLSRYCLTELRDFVAVLAAALPSLQGAAAAGSGVRWNALQLSAAGGKPASSAQDAALWHLQARYCRLVCCMRALSGLAAAAFTADRYGVLHFSSPGLGDVLAAQLGVVAVLSAFIRHSVSGWLWLCLFEVKAMCVQVDGRPAAIVYCVRGCSRACDGCSHAGRVAVVCLVPACCGWSARFYSCLTAALFYACLCNLLCAELHSCAPGQCRSAPAAAHHQRGLCWRIRQRWPTAACGSSCMCPARHRQDVHVRANQHVWPGVGECGGEAQATCGHCG
jgi:hypothetical protein